MFKFLKETFHGKGHHGYKSEVAQKKFADSILTIADRLFFLSISSLLIILLQINNSTFQSNNAIFYPAIMGSAFFMILALCCRHQGLKIHDLLEEDLSKNKRTRS